MGQIAIPREPWGWQNERNSRNICRVLPKEKELGWMGEKEEGIIDPKLEWKVEINWEIKSL